MDKKRLTASNHHHHHHHYYYDHDVLITDASIHKWWWIMSKFSALDSNTSIRSRLLSTVLMIVIDRWWTVSKSLMKLSVINLWSVSLEMERMSAHDPPWTQTWRGICPDEDCSLQEWINLPIWEECGQILMQASKHSNQLRGRLRWCQKDPCDP